MVATWRKPLDRVNPFFVFPNGIRKVIYTTNAIQSVTAQLREVIRTRGFFPTDEVAMKLVWLRLRNITAKWTHTVQDGGMQ